jgi:hypothetical protein
MQPTAQAGGWPESRIMKKLRRGDRKTTTQTPQGPHQIALP